MQGIYIITNKVNGKVYVGQDTNMPNRWYQHKYQLKKGIHENAHLQRAYIKYGPSNFSYEVVVCGPFDVEELTELEQIHLDKYKSTTGLYNILPANRSRVGIKASEETKRKMSNSGRGKIITLETRAKIGMAQTGPLNHRYGKHNTPEHKAAISRANSGAKNCLFGKHLAENTKVKISESKAGKPAPWNSRPCSNETKKKLSIANAGRFRGIPRTKEVIDKIKAGQRLRWAKYHDTKSGLVTANAA